MSKSLSFYNLTGGLNTVQTMATINSTPNRTESPEMVNVEYFKLGGLRTMNGNVGLNKDSNGVTQPLNNTTINQQIYFGYEYVKGNARYMIVADRQNLYEYNPTEDNFTLLDTSLVNDNHYTFATPADGITICGYANGIIASSPENDYLIYYKKDRYTSSLATISPSASNTIQIIETDGNRAVINSLGAGDILKIEGESPLFEIESINISTSDIVTTATIQFTTSLGSAHTDVKVYLTDFTKIYCNYVSIVQNGNSTTTTTTHFLPKVIQSHQGRLWVGAKPDGYDTATIVVYSDLGNIHNMFEGGDASFYDAGYFEEFWEDTSDITAIGTWDKYVVIHKREHTYLINTSNSDPTQWNVESYSDYTCDNQSGFVKANNGYYTYCSTAGGIYPMIQRSIYSAITQGADASVKIRDTFLNINTYALDEIYAVYHPYKKYIMFYMPFIGEGSSNNCYILDLQTKSWIHRRVPQAVSTAFTFNNKVYIGTIDGKVYEEFRGLDFDGEPIQFSWKSPWFIWGGGTNWTTTKEIRVKMSQEGTNNFFLRNRRDGNEDYKERAITNTSSKVNSLLWDEGILTGDIDEDWSNQQKVYSYSNTIDEITYTYYALEPELRQMTPMFVSQPTTFNEARLINSNAVAGSLSIKTVSTSSDYDSADWAEGTVYAYKNTATKPKYECYQSTKDSNIKAWVPYNDHTKATVNVKDQTVTTKYLAFKYYNYSGDLQSTPIYITEADYKAYWNTKNKYITAYGNVDGVMTHTATQGSVTGTSWIWTSSDPSGTAWKDNRGRACVIYTTQTGYFMFGGNPTRYSAGDKTVKTSKTTEVWNGKTTRSGKTKTVTSYSSSQIKIDGVTYKRYSAGDEGTVSNGTTTVFSSKSKLSVGDTVYTTYELSTAYGNVESVSGTNYTIQGKIFVPDSGSNHTSDATVFYKTSPIFPFKDNEGHLITYTATEVGSFNRRYQVPGSTLGDDVKVLTDTKWDESTWVNTGQITKRFLIDRQYFQTLQLEFSGETSSQGIELYGFEIDGIQLAETPWQ